ncbi:MAG: hypothetical protein LBL86_07225 [Coriobacteriales bacterium]|jgi:hypothetical protein|nr:hypothetical protein [Coriobacteriales bacterium]
MTRNTLGDLNNHLFEALERINDESLEGEELDAEIRRARAVTGVASQVIANGNLALAATRLKDEALGADLALPPMLDGGGR